MKYNSFLKIIMFGFVCAFIATSCVKDGPMGPAGADGEDGINGTNGTNGSDGKDGVDGNVTCLQCHTLAIMDALDAQYKLSKHFTGTTSSRNGKYCARCHTSQGFEEVVGNGKFVVTNDMPNATRISCATCHDHKSLDFSKYDASLILASTSPVTLEYYKNLKSQDYGKINNLCATCHQIRGATATAYSDTTLTPDVINKSFDQIPFFPLDNTKEATTVKYQQSQSFSVHDGNQANLVAGINGYEYAGKTYTRTWKHSDFSCTDCHMNEYNSTTKTGGHTLIVNEEACKTCHGGSDKITMVQTAIDAKRVELGEELFKKKLFNKSTNSSGVVSYSAVNSHDFNGTLYETTESTIKYASRATDNKASATTGLVVYGGNVVYAVDKAFATRIGREWKYGELGAAYNYGYINSELSKGVHNPVYAMQILQNSIDYLKSY